MTLDHDHTPDCVRNGRKRFPECAECQCYPECRTDCADFLECVERLPEYAERVFGPNQEKWPQSIRDTWAAKGWVTWGERYAEYLASKPKHEPEPEPRRWWQFWLRP